MGRGRPHDHRDDADLQPAEAVVEDDLPDAEPPAGGPGEPLERRDRHRLVGLVAQGHDPTGPARIGPDPPEEERDAAGPNVLEFLEGARHRELPAGQEEAHRLSPR